MRLLAATAACLATAIAYGQGDTIQFKRTFKLNEAGVYACSFGDVGKPAKITTDISYSVTKLEAEIATVDYHALALMVNGKLDKSLQPALYSKVGPNGMATDASAAKQSDILFVLLDAAGITPNATVDSKSGVPVTWQNAAKNFGLEGSGTVTSTDKTAKTMTVDWIMKFTTTGITDGQLKLTSVYSTEDFSLKSSKGTLTTGNDPVLSITISRAEAAPAKPK